MDNVCNVSLLYMLRAKKGKQPKSSFFFTLATLAIAINKIKSGKAKQKPTVNSEAMVYFEAGLTVLEHLTSIEPFTVFVRHLLHCQLVV